MSRSESPKTCANCGTEYFEGEACACGNPVEANPAQSSSAVSRPEPKSLDPKASVSGAVGRMEPKGRFMWIAIAALFIWCLSLQLKLSNEVETLTAWGDDAGGVITRNGERAQRRLDDLDDRISSLEYHLRSRR